METASACWECVKFAILRDDCREACTGEFEGSVAREMLLKRRHGACDRIAIEGRIECLSNVRASREGALGTILILSSKIVFKSGE